MSSTHTIIQPEVYNFHLLLNSNTTTTTHIHIGSTAVYTLGLYTLGPTRIFLFCCELVAVAALEVDMLKRQ
jgi:hypothetical protein